MAELESKPETHDQRNEMDRHTDEERIEQGGDEVVHQALVRKKGAPVVAGAVDRHASISVEGEHSEVRDRGECLIGGR